METARLAALLWISPFWISIRKLTAHSMICQKLQTTIRYVHIIEMAFDHFLWACF